MSKYFSSNLKYLRSTQKISQQELADRLKNIDRSTISRWESEDIDPTIGNVIQIASVLNVPIEDLIGKDLQQQKIDTFDNFYNANKHLLNEDDKETIRFLIEKRKANETKNKNS